MGVWLFSEVRVEMADRQGCRTHTFNVVHLFLQLGLQLDGGRQQGEKEGMAFSELGGKWRQVKTKKHHNTRPLSGWKQLAFPSLSPQST